MTFHKHHHEDLIVNIVEDDSLAEDPSNNNNEMKFVPHYSGEQLSHMYDTMKDHTILQIQKNFK